MTAEAEQDSPLAAMDSTTLDADIVRLMRIDRALKSGLSWAQVGVAFHLSGKEMKRETRALDRRVQRQLMAAKGRG